MIFNTLEKRDELAKESHTKWLMFLNDSPIDTGCSQSPTEVFLEAFKDGFDSGYKYRDDEVDDEILKATQKYITDETAKIIGDTIDSVVDFYRPWKGSPDMDYLFDRWHESVALMTAHHLKEERERSQKLIDALKVLREKSVAALDRKIARDALEEHKAGL